MLSCRAKSTDGLHTEYPSVLRVDGIYRMWYSGYGVDAKGIEAWRIHYATSNDGIHWTKHGVVLDCGGPESWESTGVAFPWVIRHQGLYLMWYGGQRAGKYAIGLAKSWDGIHWTRSAANPVLTADHSIVDPSVIFDAAGKRFLMWVNTLGDRYSCDLAFSSDGRRWARYEHNPVLKGGAPNEWDEAGMYTVNVLRDGAGYKMWYAVGLNGRGASLGLATSSDGIHWTKSPSNPFTVGPIGSDDAWNAFGDFFYGMHVIRDGGVLKMWTNGIGGADRAGGAIAYATSRDGVRWTKGADKPVVCPEGWPGPD